jgi:hypothetical protein
MKKFEASTNMETTKIMDAHMTCEVCDNVWHSGNDCLETREQASFINNGNNKVPQQQLQQSRVELEAHLHIQQSKWR